MVWVYIFYQREIFMTTSLSLFKNVVSALPIVSHDNIQLADNFYYCRSDDTVVFFIDKVCLKLDLLVGKFIGNVNENVGEKIGDVRVNYYWGGEVDSIGDLKIGYLGGRVASIGDVVIQRTFCGNEIVQIRRGDKVLYNHRNNSCTIL